MNNVPLIIDKEVLLKCNIRDIPPFKDVAIRRGEGFLPFTVSRMGNIICVEYFESSKLGGVGYLPSIMLQAKHDILVQCKQIALIDWKEGEFIRYGFTSKTQLFASLLEEAENLFLMVECAAIDRLRKVA